MGILNLVIGYQVIQLEGFAEGEAAPEYIVAFGAEHDRPLEYR